MRSGRRPLSACENVWLLLILFSVQQAFFAINQPTRSAVLPRLLPPAQLPAANSLNMTVTGAGAIAGPLVGGALIPVLGFSVLYLVDTLSLFATLWAVVRLPKLPPLGIPAGTPGLRAVLDGFAYLRGHTVLLMSFVVDIIAMVFGLPRALFPQVAHQSFGGPVDGGLAFALLFAGIPAGAVLGGVLSGWVSGVRRQGRAVVSPIIGVGARDGRLRRRGRAGPAGHHAMLVVAVLALMLGGAADMASPRSGPRCCRAPPRTTSAGGSRACSSWSWWVGHAIADVLHGAAAVVIGTAWTAFLGGVLVLVLVAGAVSCAPAFWRYRVEGSDRSPAGVSPVGDRRGGVATVPPRRLERFSPWGAAERPRTGRF